MCHYCTNVGVRALVHYPTDGWPKGHSSLRSLGTKLHCQQHFSFIIKMRFHHHPTRFHAVENEVASVRIFFLTYVFFPVTFLGLSFFVRRVRKLMILRLGINCAARGRAVLTNQWVSQSFSFLPFRLICTKSFTYGCLWTLDMENITATFQHNQCIRLMAVENRLWSTNWISVHW